MAQSATPTACRRTVSGTISLPYLGCFSPFPYGTGSLSVSEEYLALPDGAGRFKQDSSGPALLRILRVHINLRLRGYHPLWLNFPKNSTWWCFLNVVLQPSSGTPLKFRLFPVRSPLLRESLVIFFSSGYLDVSVLRVGFPLLAECYTFSITGCPIRKSRDVILVCSSPWLIAAYHVLRRLSDPRHPPYALNCFKKVYTT
jgi:hypothetical protein